MDPYSCAKFHPSATNSFVAIHLCHLHYVPTYERTTQSVPIMRAAKLCFATRIKNENLSITIACYSHFLNVVHMTTHVVACMNNMPQHVVLRHFQHASICNLRRQSDFYRWAVQDVATPGELPGEIQTVDQHHCWPAHL